MSRDSIEILHRLSRAISQTAGIAEIYEIILEEIAHAWQVERASIMRFDPESKHLKIVAARGIEREIWESVAIAVGEGVSGQVFSEGKPLLIQGKKGNTRYKTHSFMVAPVTCFPMQVGQTPIGIINLTDKKSGEPFTEDDLKLLTTLADQAASYLHLCDLMERLKVAEKVKLQLEVARTIQQKLLPKNILSIKGVDVAGALIPAERVGADYYDLVTHDDTLSFSIADVSGHDVGGALLAFASRSCLRSNLEQEKKTNRVVEGVNQTLFNDLFQSEQFISLFLGQYHPKKKTLFYTNAGHPPPILWRAKEKRGEWLLTDDSLLGIEPGLIYHQKKVKLEKEDVILLYTDGLTEAQNPNGERFGGNRLLETLSQNANENAQTLLAKILDHWRHFIGNQPVQDDVTVLVIKVG
ncbi:MAG: SpoIIE family protein phosphatase [Deltaproteobacteria bacterium]|nr:SpoIIE family protein phosphatase [Deltaproteobacteria bacterium]